MFERQDSLPLIMREVSHVLGAKGIALTIHPDDGEPARIVHADADAGIPALVRSLLGGEFGQDDGDMREPYRWVTCPSGSECGDMLLMSVPRVLGHSRLMIAACFDRCTPERRASAEQVYRTRGTFAAEMFRLWQTCRIRGRELRGLRSALNVVDMGVLLVDRSGRLVFANRSATMLLDQQDGLRRFQNMLRADNLQDSIRLQVALEHVIRDIDEKPGRNSLRVEAPLLSVRRHDKPPLTVSVMPTEDRPVEASDAAAIVFVVDPANDVEQMIRPVCQSYHMSPVETRLACLLTSGDTVAGAAKRMRVKEMTARSYLKQIFLKTNTHRQSELVQLMLSSVVRTAPAITNCTV